MKAGLDSFHSYFFDDMCQLCQLRNYLHEGMRKHMHHSKKDTEVQVSRYLGICHELLDRHAQGQLQDSVERIRQRVVAVQLEHPKVDVTPR
jgi:hypothetical protein